MVTMNLVTARKELKKSAFSRKDGRALRQRRGLEEDGKVQHPSINFIVTCEMGLKGLSNWELSSIW